MHLALRTLTHSPWLRPFNDPTVWQAIAKFFNRNYRSQGIGAQVVRVIEQTADCKTFELRTNHGMFGARWPQSHLAGQHCVLSLQINGRQVHRSFSISSAPGEPVQITVKANQQATGRLSVSRWMLEHLQPGSELTLSSPFGEFNLPNQLFTSAISTLTLISAGSGITPIRAILRALYAQNRDDTPAKVHLIHLCRDAADFIFGVELSALARAWPALTITTHYSSTLGRITPAHLYAYLGTDLGQTIYLCGPSTLHGDLFAALDQAGYHGPRRSEHFGTLVRAADLNTPLQLELEQHEIKQLFTVTANQSLLQTLEAAGARVASGCRIGICNTCQCLKRAGAVQNLRTGEIHDAPNELIRLCISAPLSSLSLSL